MPKRKTQKRGNHPKKVQKFAHEDQFKDVEYYFENGLRKIKPYVYKFEAHAKGRWFGCKLLDVFKKEFRLESAEYYQTAIKEGLIRVNKAAALPDRILKNNDFMQSKVHRHEPPVSGDPIQILVETEDYLVINKPASIPVHPCGKYRHNTLVFILGKEYGFRGLHTIHRLDRLTSGLLVFARTLEVSHRLDAYVRDRLLEKTYVCKVRGEFPSEPIECNEPIFIVSHKIGVCRVKSDGKPCKTRFLKMSFDGETSIVKCHPHTGRMHQIRVHLQYLGYPIINDPLYNNPVWGSEKGKGGIQGLTDEQLLKDLIDQHDIVIDSALEKARLQILINKKKGPGSPSQAGESPVKPEGISPGNPTSQEGCNPTKAAPLLAEDVEGAVTSCIDGNTVDKLDSRTEEGDKLTVNDSNQSALAKMDSSASDTRTPQESSSGENLGNCSTSTAGTEGTCPVVNSSNRSEEIPDDDAVPSKPDDDGAFQRDNATVVCGGDAKSSQVDGSSEGRMGDAQCGNTARSENGTVEEVRESPSGSTDLGTSRAHETVDALSQGQAQGQEEDGSRIEGSSRSTGQRDTGAADDERLEDERTDKLVTSLCRECRDPMPDPEPNEMCIYLHALTYKGPDFEFSAPMPAWANEHFDRTGAKFS